MGAASLRKGKPGRVDVDLEIVVADLVLISVAANVVRNVGPRTQTVDLRALQKEELFVCTPFSVEYGKRVLFDYSVWMCLWLMRITERSLCKALDTKIIFIAGAVGTPDSNLCKVKG